MVSNDDLAALCVLAKNAGADILIAHDADALREEGRTIIESVTVLSGIPGIGPHPMGAIAAAELLREAKAKGLLLPVIVSAEIGPMPRPMPEGVGAPMPLVRVTLADGQSVDLFRFYPDELSFKPEDFVGLKLAQAKQLRFTRDRDFLLDVTPAQSRVMRDV